jgi:hypothetical protein
MKRIILVVLAIAALAAPVAAAGGPEQLTPVQRIIRQEDRGGHVSIASAPTSLTPAQRIVLQEQARKTDLALAGAGPVAAPIEIVTSSGFHWGDAGIGAAVVAAVMLVLAGTFTALRAARPRRA